LKTENDITKEIENKFVKKECLDIRNLKNLTKNCPKDRMDNTKGYSLENSVPCCKFCNLTKNDTSFIEFINWIRTVYKNTEKLDMDKIPCNIQKG